MGIEVRRWPASRANAPVEAPETSMILMPSVVGAPSPSTLVAGGAYSWADGRYAVYGEVSYNTSLSQAGDSYSYKGTGGFRIVW